MKNVNAFKNDYGKECEKAFKAQSYFQCLKLLRKCDFKSLMKYFYLF